MKTDQEKVKQLEKALIWALEHGAHLSYDGDAFYDKGCGCCVGTVEPPDNLKSILTKISNKITRKKNAKINHAIS